MNSTIAGSMNARSLLTTCEEGRICIHIDSTLAGSMNARNQLTTC
jgi:hypothetical protein